MMPTTGPRLTEAFHPDVLAFRQGPFALAEHLQWLDRQRSIGATEGVVLYCGRILEVLVREALTQSKLFDPEEKLMQPDGADPHPQQVADPLADFPGGVFHALHLAPDGVRQAGRSRDGYDLYRV
jgi:hypothetical protein